MEIIKKHIEEERPNITQSSVKTYTSIIYNLWKKVFNDKAPNIKELSTNANEILKGLEDIPPSRRKTTLSALYVISHCPLYKEQMLKDIKITNDETNKQELTKENKQNWVSDNGIKTRLDELKKNADILYKKANLTGTNLQHIQDYIILFLYSGLIPIRRSKDYVEMKIKNIENNKDNFFDPKKSEFIFNTYKTSKFYGTQTIKLNPTNKKIINKWISVNPTDWLLFDSHGNKLNAVKLNQRINGIFGKKNGTGVNALRHSFLTNKYGDTIKTNMEMAKDLTSMGSSMAQEKTYIKGEIKH